MAWEEEHGSVLRQLRRRADRMPPPSEAELAAVDQRLAEIQAMAPPLDEASNMVVRAWHDVGTCRDFSVGGPLPFTAVLDWANFHGLDHAATAMIWAALRFVDGEKAEAEASKRSLDKIRGKR